MAVGLGVAGGGREIGQFVNQFSQDNPQILSKIEFNSPCTNKHLSYFVSKHLVDRYMTKPKHGFIDDTKYCSSKFSKWVPLRTIFLVQSWRKSHNDSNFHVGWSRVGRNWNMSSGFSTHLEHLTPLES